MKATWKVIAASFAFFTASAVSHADTVTMKFVSVGGANDGTYYIYPYNFSVNGSQTTLPLMCVSFNNEVTLGETWTATRTLINSFSSVLNQEDAYLFSLIGTNGTTVQDVQEAVWYLSAGSNAGKVNASLYDKTLASNAQAAVSGLSGKTPAWDSGEFYLYTPVPGTQNPSTDNLPQSYIGMAPTPEPGSLALLATGLISTAGILYRKRKASF